MPVNAPPDAVLPAGTVALDREPLGWAATLRGEVDLAVVDGFVLTDPDRVLAGDALVVAVDAGEVTFLDSSGLSLLLRWAMRARQLGQVTELRAASPAVRTLLRLSATESLFATSGLAGASAGQQAAGA